MAIRGAGATPAAVIGDKTLQDLGWPTLVEHWTKRCATKRGEAHVRSFPLFSAVEDARARAAEISEARHLASRDAALPQPHQGDRVGAVEQFGLDAADAALAVALDAAQGADHGDFLAALTVDRLLRAGAGGLVAEFLDVELLGVFRQSAGEPTQIPFGRSHDLSLPRIRRGSTT